MKARKQAPRVRGTRGRSHSAHVSRETADVDRIDDVPMFDMLDLLLSGSRDEVRQALLVFGAMMLKEPPVVHALSTSDPIFRWLCRALVEIGTPGADANKILRLKGTGRDRSSLKRTKRLLLSVARLVVDEGESEAAALKMIAEDEGESVDTINARWDAALNRFRNAKLLAAKFGADDQISQFIRDAVKNRDKILGLNKEK